MLRRAEAERAERRKKAIERERAAREGRTIEEAPKKLSKWQLMDMEAQKFNDEYNKKHRPESLVSIHQKRVRMAGSCWMMGSVPDSPGWCCADEGGQEKEEEGEEARNHSRWVCVPALEPRHGPGAEPKSRRIKADEPSRPVEQQVFFRFSQSLLVT